MQVINKWLALGLSLIALTILWAYLFFWLWEKPDVLVVRMPDDAFYYLKIARNLASGHGLTFDGINPTNGFQPLWLLMLLIPASLGRSLSAEAFHRLAMIYQIAIFMLGLILLNATTTARFNLLNRAVLNTLALAIGITTLLRGMEPAAIWLVFCLLMFWLVRVVNLQRAHAWQWGVLGGLLGLVFLARLDMVFFIAIYMLALLWRLQALPTPNRLHNGVCLIMGFLTAATPYLLYNAIQFGDIMPISGRLKSTFPHISLLSYDVPPIPATATLAMIVGLLASFWLWKVLRAYDDECLLLCCWCLGSLLHWLHTLLFMKWGILISHFASYWIPLPVLVPKIAQQAEVHRSYPTKVIVLASITATLLWAYQDVRACYRIKYTSPVHWRTSMYHAALWAKRHTPSNAVFGMTDAGIFGYYSERKVINLDGVVNNREYQNYLRRRQLKEYLRCKRVKYIVVYVVSNSPRFPTPSQQGDRLTDVYWGHYREFRFGYYARMYGDTPSDEISLLRENELYRERHLKGMLIAWKLNLH